MGVAVGLEGVVPFEFRLYTFRVEMCLTWSSYYVELRVTLESDHIELHLIPNPYHTKLHSGHSHAA